jgi:hypothetical protein
MTDTTLPRDVVERALEALLSVKNHGWNEDTHTGRALIAILRSRLAQPEQEAVGVVHHKLTSRLGADYEQVAVFSRPVEPGTKLYTAPPQREWVGLTDEEIDYLYVEHRGDGGPTAVCEQFAKAYEACLKEKNT